jgi:hypothetical protein
MFYKKKNPLSRLIMEYKTLQTKQVKKKINLKFERKKNK